VRRWKSAPLRTPWRSLRMTFLSGRPDDRN
jgi:hypothetical protein